MKDPAQSIRSLVSEVAKSFLANESRLIEIDANERSLTHRFATHLEFELRRRFPKLGNLHVDCEYNRDGFDPKKLALPVSQIDSRDTEVSTVFPDIVVHERETHENNLIVIEAKKRCSSALDRQKIEAFLSQLQYRLGALLVFEQRQALRPSAIKLTWFRMVDGAIVEEATETLLAIA